MLLLLALVLFFFSGAKAKEPLAMTCLASLLREGRGVAKDVTAAIKYLTVAAGILLTNCYYYCYCYYDYCYCYYYYCYYYYGVTVAIEYITVAAGILLMPLVLYHVSFCACFLFLSAMHI